MNDFFNNQWIFQLIRKRFFHFVIIGIAAILLSIVFSSPAFITPKYKSTCRIYPSNLGEMSEESFTEQTLEIIKSVDIKLRMFDAFKLDEVYGISKKDPKYRAYMLDIFNKNVNFTKTEFETVEITVLDKDPVRAANMCDSLIQFYNEKVREMHSLKNWEMVKTLTDDMKYRIEERDSLKALLDTLRTEYKVFDIVVQGPEITRGYMRAMADGQSGSSGGREIKQIYENLLEKGTEIHILERRFESIVFAINELKVLQDKHLSEAKKKITYSNIVEKPQVAVEKAYPVRWIMVAMTLCASLFLSLLLFVLLDYYKIK